LKKPRPVPTPYRFEDIARSIDHALLSPALTERELEAGCKLAAHYAVASVCVMPYWLPKAALLLRGTSVLPSTTIAFPHGVQATSVKLVEAVRALDDGAEELDVVANISRMVSGDLAYVRSELAAITDVAHGRGKKVKIIFENSYLDEAQKIALCNVVGAIGADWAKTSTGFSSSGATLDDVRSMRAHCPPAVQIKASGGIHDLDALLAFRALGATRIGTSRTRDILEECRKRLAG
jgi:deoxyribose-phosphate aldolase